MQTHTMQQGLLVLVACAEGNRVLVTDLKSTNGTFIEEEEIEAMVPNDLPLGSEVIFGAAL
jgi:pSer/pThr/pTyr-binding forkhead associated (FHA) protein